MTIEKEKLVILRPLGVQGPKIGIRLTSEEDAQKLDEAMDKLHKEGNYTTEAVLETLKEIKLPVIDS